MKILMIDRSSAIDRRILLEADSLTKHGHSVFIVSASSLEVDQRLLSSQMQVEFVKDDFLVEPRLFARRDKLAPYFGHRLALLLAALSMPSEGYQFIRHANSLPRSCKFFLGSILAPMSESSTFREAARNLLKSFQAAFHSRFVPDDWEERVLERLEGEIYHVVHVHDLPVLSLGVALKEKLSAKLVYDAHELYCYLPGMSSQAQVNLKAIEARDIRAADLVVVVNDDQAQQMRADYGDFPYVCLTNATTDIKTERGEENPIRTRIGIAESDKVILFQGFVSKERNIDSLIEGVALASSKPHCVFLSWGPHISEFRDLARRLGAEDRIHFFPPVPWDQVLDWARAADVGILPYQPTCLNTIISSPNKMYEFILAQTPMIGSRELVNVRRTIEDNGFGLAVQLRESRDYAAAIDEIFSQNSAKYSQAKVALATKWQEFTWEALSKDFIEEYKKLEVV